YFDEAADKVKGAGELSHTVLLVLSVLVISPLGYLLTKCLGTLADNAAAALFYAY
ncbi:MAG: NADH-quinone oxidoreductase subunit N, partial [Novosphingobium sp.]|nr:NADH-quinone oxidoreductase subunit N [Novosphingobium sp.]